MKIFFYIYQYFISCWVLVKTQLVYRVLFNRIGHKSRIYPPLRLNSVNNISLGSNVTILKGVWLLTHQEGAKLPKMRIKSGVVIGHFNHITCVDSVIIEENVITADRVYISDNFHRYEDINKPIKLQPIASKGPVTIGSGSWLGENVSVISASVGKHCVIGANSVVTKDIPDYSIAVGAPAKVVKRYDFDIKEWITVGK